MKIFQIVVLLALSMRHAVATQRKLLSCRLYTKKKDCNTGCNWSQGSCKDSATPAPVAAPTPAPVVAPTPAPVVAPTPAPVPTPATDAPSK
jgi:hypothetical protein